MHLNCYQSGERFYLSDRTDLPLKAVPQPAADAPLLWLFSRAPQCGRTAFCVSDVRQLTVPEENVAFLDPSRIPEPGQFPQRLRRRIAAGALQAVNIQHPRWEESIRFSHQFLGHRRVNLLAVGDVGGTLLTGLKLLGGDCIASIGICDLNDAVVRRWTAEMAQVSWPWNYDALPKVEPVDREHLFDCDVFLFAATKSIPPVGSKIQDVRMAQFDANRTLVETYARQARSAHFSGLFCVLSDPVDPLCRAAFLASNRGENGSWDGQGLFAEQIHGLGLGVMNARAAALAQANTAYRSFLNEGRSFGPHGQGLVLANSIEHYDDVVSRALTDEVLEANLRIRELGFKPYVAPALSSGAFQLLSLLRGQWHCGSVPLGNVWFGCRNRFTFNGLETENLCLPDPLFARLRETEQALAAII